MEKEDTSLIEVSRKAVTIAHACDRQRIAVVERDWATIIEAAEDILKLAGAR